MRLKTDFFEYVQVLRDSYASAYDEAQAIFDRDSKNLRENYKPGSSLFVEQRDKIPEVFKASVDKAREEAKSGMKEVLSVEMSRLNSEINATGHKSTMELKGFLDMMGDYQWSYEETNAIVEKYKNQNYYTDRLLQAFAQKNGNYSNLHIVPDYGKRKEILSAVQDDFMDFVSQYGTEEKKHLSSFYDLTDSELQRKESLYTSEYSGIELNPKETAKIAVHNILREKTIMNRAALLAKTVKSTGGEIRREIMYLLSDSFSPHDEVIRLSGTREVFDAFMAEDYKDMSYARKHAKKIEDLNIRNQAEGLTEKEFTAAQTHANTFGNGTITQDDIDFVKSPEWQNAQLETV